MKVLNRDSTLVLVGTKKEQWLCYINEDRSLGRLYGPIEQGQLPCQSIADAIGGASAGEVAAVLETISAIKHPEQQGTPTFGPTIF